MKIFRGMLTIFSLADSPVFKVVPEDVTGDLGAAVRLECRADSNPPASYTWRLGEDRVGTGNTGL